MSLNRRMLGGLTVVTGIGVLVLAALRNTGPEGGVTQPPADQPVRGASAVKSSPKEFDQLLAVMAGGGTTLELENAIGFLDSVTRTGRALTDTQRVALLAALEHGTPAGLSEGAWSHIFNSSCNALAVGRPAADEALLGLLERVAKTDPRRVMRLYSLQHLGLLYAAANPTARQRMRALVQCLLADPSSQTAGTALVLWRSWERTAGPGEISSLDLSRAIAADAQRPVDVRVTALHAIGDDPGVLDLARAIAPDKSQPVILRKAALNLIGRHGEERDLEVLRLCGRGNPRLAQAGDPAARSLKDRLAGRPQPVLRPY